MRILFLVLLLILNVYAEANGSGTVRQQIQTKREKSAVGPQKSVQKFEFKSKQKMDFETKGGGSGTVRQKMTALESTAVKSKNVANNVIVVRDTVVDTVYVTVPETGKTRTEKEYNIPLPHQSAFLGKGLSVGIGAGLFNASKDCDCLGIWQGQLEYHYKNNITGGIDVRFFGGTLDQDVMLMYQRYRLNARAHASFSWIDFYASVLFGLETTDLSEFRKELREGVRKNHSDDSNKVALLDELSEDLSDSLTFNDETDSVIDENSCEKMFSLDGFTLGFEAGMGVVVGPYLGFVGSASYEFNFSWAQQVTFSPGIAFNLHEVWPWAGRNLRSTWISFEMVFQRYFNRNVNEWAVAGFLGLQFGI